MINRYAVNGTCFVQVGVGDAGALETLGYTEAGVDLEITEFKEEIITDLFGVKTPQDFQAMGLMARVSVPLIAYDDDIFDEISTRGDQFAIGAMSTPGLVLGIGGYAFSLALTTVFDFPYFFQSALLQTQSTRRATKANPFRFDFICWPYAPYTATSGKSVPLYTRTLP